MTSQARAGGKFLGNTPTLGLIESLNNAFVSIRKNHPELPNAVLVVGASGRKRNGAVHGHFSPDVWTAKNATHEIMLSGESLARGAEATLGTLLHECAHLLAAVRGIKDTSRQGRFHNKRFKALAEELGIEVHRDPTIGWSVTTLPRAAETKYRAELSLMRKALKGHRIEQTGPKSPAKLTLKVWCDCRSITLPQSFLDKGEIRCEECGQLFVEYETSVEA